VLYAPHGEEWWQWDIYYKAGKTRAPITYARPTGEEPNQGELYEEGMRRRAKLVKARAKETVMHSACTLIEMPRCRDFEVSGRRSHGGADARRKQREETTTGHKGN
jgi:hypothetical protein